jgi:acylphosphatase
MVRIRVVVHGRVQGVGYRFSARVEAQRLGVTGWIKNRNDGSVEAEIEGDRGSVEQMLSWLDEGPPGAEVTALTSSDADPTGDPGFRVLA